MNVSSSSIPEFLTFSLQVVFLIIIIITLGVLLFFKMYRKFIYRLLLYAFVALIISSISWTGNLLTIIKVQGQQVELETFTNSSISIIILFQYIYAGSILLFFLLLTSMSLYMYILAIHHHQFTSWVADLIFLLVCLILSQLSAISMLTLRLPYQAPVSDPIEVTCYILIFLATVCFTALTLVPMCFRACGYNNLCMRSVATRESHQQALREILPLFILLSPSVGTLACIILELAWKSAKVLLLEKWLPSIDIFTAGLLLPLSFAVHLCILGKTKLKKLRGKKRPLPTTYGTIANQPHTHRPTVFTSEGISETCNTDYPHVSEDEVDRELLQHTTNWSTTLLMASRKQQLINNTKQTVTLHTYMYMHMYISPLCIKSPNFLLQSKALHYSADVSVVIAGVLCTLDALQYFWLHAAIHMHASNNQCSKAAVLKQNSKSSLCTHRRLSNTMSTCTIWVCARLNCQFVTLCTVQWM